MEDFQMYSKIQQEKKQGFSKDATARHLGLNWRTVDQYWEMTAEDYEAMQKRQYNSELDKRREIVLQWLKGYDDVSAAQIEDWLAEHYNEHYSPRTVRDYVAKLRLHYDIPRLVKGREYGPIPELPPGVQLQADFGEYNALRPGMSRIKLYFLVLILAHSRYKYIIWQTRNFTSLDRKIAHDLKNQLMPSVLYLQQGKQEKSLWILEQLIETLNDLQKTPDITGFAMIDLILSIKKAKAQTYGIQINVNSLLADPIYVPDPDISVILGNALDNAIEAVAKIEDNNKKMIDVIIRSGRGLFSIKIENPVDHEVNIQNGKIRSSKADDHNHGIGLESVRSLINKNKGFLDLQCENRIFTLSISLKNLPLNA